MDTFKIGKKAKGVEAIKAKVSGVVQGVGFRYYVQQVAKKLGLAGRVRNISDGSVEVVAEGEHDQLMLLIEQMTVGPSSAEVSDIEVSWFTPDVLKKDFIIE